MAIDQCDPCACTPPNISWEVYKVQFMQVLCAILLAAQGGGDPDAEIVPCEPCLCIPTNIPDEVFKQQSLVVLCQVLEALSGP